MYDALIVGRDRPDCPPRPATPPPTLAAAAGRPRTDQNAVAVNPLGQTGGPGVFADGDLAHSGGPPVPPAFAVIAAAPGTTAGTAIDRDPLTADARDHGPQRKVSPR